MIYCHLIRRSRTYPSNKCDLWKRVRLLFPGFPGNGGRERGQCYGQLLRGLYGPAEGQGGVRTILQPPRAQDGPDALECGELI